MIDMLKTLADLVNIKNCDGCNQVNIPAKSGDDLLSGVITAMMILTGVIAVVSLIICAYKMMMSNGDPKAVLAAKHGIIAIVVGVIVVLAAFAITKTIVSGAQGDTSGGAALPSRLAKCPNLRPRRSYSILPKLAWRKNQ